MKNPYEANVKDKQVAWINPLNGDMSIVGSNDGGDMTSFQQKTADEFIVAGFVKVEDEEIIKKLRRGVMNTSNFSNVEEWQKWFESVSKLVVGYGDAEIEEAKLRLKAYAEWKEYLKPVK